MALRFTRSCDYKAGSRSRPPAEHEAETVIKLEVDGVTYSMDICREHIADVVEMNLARGFHPIAAVVGHNRRGAYLTKSGQPFTTKQAREWLSDNGHDVAEVGRLTADQLQAYAAAH